MIFLGSVLLVVSAGFSYLLNTLMYRYSRKLGIESTNANVVRWASTTKPTVGGISFYITFILAGLVFFITQNRGTLIDKEFLIATIVVTLGFIVGLHDDAYETKPLLKFLGQVTCALILIAFGLHIRLFDFWPVDYFLTIFWVVGIMNSINLLDNMDGVTATVSLSIVGATILRMVIFPTGEMNPFLFTLIATCGAFVGFLGLNWKPSRIYMGDTGSQFLGALLAMIGIKFFWNFEFDDGRSIPWLTRAIVPVMLFLVPIMDTTFVTFSRIRRGRSPFVGGKDHLTHNMSHFGIAEKWVPMVLGLVSLASGFLAVFGLRYLLTWSAWQAATFVGYILVTFFVFYLIYRRGEAIGMARQRFTRTFERAFNEKRESDEKSDVAKQHS